MNFSRRIFMSAAPMLAAGAVTAAPLSPPPPVRSFSADLGLKPGGKGDQSAILQKAIAKAAERGLALLLPGGTYELQICASIAPW